MAARPARRCKCLIISTLLDSNQRIRVLQTLALPLGERCEMFGYLFLCRLFLADRADLVNAHRTRVSATTPLITVGYLLLIVSGF